MNERLVVGVLGNRNSGKSHTWNSLFGRVVKTGKYPHHLELRPGKCVEVFLISGSPEERQLYAGSILKNQKCQIVLCSMQYTESVRKTLSYFTRKNFFSYIQWLNPGYHDRDANWDELGLVNQMLSAQSVLTMRDGRSNAADRVREIRDFIDGWASSRGLVFDCEHVT